MAEFTSNHSLGAKSTQHNQYFTPTLEEYRCDAASIHVSINDILTGPNITMSLINYMGTLEKYQIPVESITLEKLPSTRTKINIFYINKKLRHLCMKYHFEFINHQQISTNFLWNDGIHLLDTGKSMLGQYLVNRVSNLFAKMIRL